MPAILSNDVLIERKQENHIIEDIIGMEETEKLIGYYSDTIWDISANLKLTTHISLVATYLYRIFTLNTKVDQYDCMLAAVTCVFLSAKLENGYQLALRHVCHKFKGIEEEKVKDCEMQILEGNDYDLFIKTPWLPLIGLYNDCQFFSEAEFELAIKFLRRCTNGDIVHVYSAPKIAAACFLAVLLDLNTNTELFYTYFEAKHNRARQDEMAPIPFKQWRSEIDLLSKLLLHKSTYDKAELKDIKERLNSFRNTQASSGHVVTAKSNRPRSDSTSPESVNFKKRGNPSPATGTPASKK
eukprot:NODE_628_length_5237_cov_0.539510.p2 type:complete len:298 gc:universal NODE_628_length_5237_cov_0.539510:1201-308(-)